MSFQILLKDSTKEIIDAFSQPEFIPKEEVCTLERNFIFTDTNRTAMLERILLSKLTGIVCADNSVSHQRKYIIVAEPANVISLYINHIAILKIATAFLKKKGYMLNVANVLPSSFHETHKQEKTVLKVVIGLPLKKVSLVKYEQLMTDVSDLIKIINKIPINVSLNYKCNFCGAESMFLYPNVCAKHFEALSLDSVKDIANKVFVSSDKLVLFDNSLFDYHDNLLLIMGLAPLRILNYYTIKKDNEEFNTCACLACGNDASIDGYPVQVCRECASKIKWVHYVVDFINWKVNVKDIVNNKGILKYM